MKEPAEGVTLKLRPVEERNWPVKGDILEAMGIIDAQALGQTQGGRLSSKAGGGRQQWALNRSYLCLLHSAVAAGQMTDGAWGGQGPQNGCVEEGIARDPLVSLSILTVSGTAVNMCSGGSQARVALKPSARLEQGELTVIQAPDPARGGKAVHEKQKAKPLLTVGPF